MTTLAQEIQNMSNEEVASMNRVLGRMLVKRIAITAVVCIAINMAVNVIMDKMDSNKTS